jgi:ribosomal protein S18 acetylase RimI-like enzyme
MSAPELEFRAASRKDLPALVRLLADDMLGESRERPGDPLPESYGKAFDAIEQDPNNELIVAAMNGRVVGMLQLTYIPGISRQGSWRALIEAVRVDSTLRSEGVGRKLIARAIDRARERGCAMVQLTSDKQRADAIRFYQSLGFVASHEGLKLQPKP